MISSSPSTPSSLMCPPIVSADEILTLPGSNPSRRVSKSVIHQEIRERKVEVGRFDKIKELHVILYYENFPTWLLMCDALECLSITVSGVSSMDQFLTQCSAVSDKLFLQQCVMLIGIEKFSFLQTVHQVQHDSLVLISGSWNFLQTLPTHVGCLWLFVLDGNFQGRLRKGRPSGVLFDHIRWFRMHHTSFGGATDYVALFASNMSTMSPGLSNIRRSIRDFFNAGDKPAMLKAGSIPVPLPDERSFYVLSDVLRHKQLDLLVYHPTHYFFTGWGQRHLTFPELCGAYGYPRPIHNILNDWVFTYPPYQMLLQMFRAAVFSFPESSTLSQPSETVFNSPVFDRALSPSYVPTVGSTWIESIQTWLPDTWTGSAIARSSAAKNDDAVIPTHLWESRITLVLPHVQKFVPLFQEVCLRRARRNLASDFYVYLRSRYGNTWSIALSFHRRRRGRLSMSIRHKGGKATKSNHGTALDLDLKDLTLGSYSKTTAPDLAANNTLQPHELEEEYGNQLLHETDTGCTAIVKFTAASWWEWSNGSSLAFWRWSDETVAIARDGMAPFICNNLPTWKPVKLKTVRDLNKRTLIAKKLQTIVDRHYLSPGKVVSYTDFFDVPKGTDDIRLVYNGTSCGLNQALWAPNFWLPFPRSASRLLDFNSYSGDIDLGEMFHNFPLHETLQQYSGIDLTPFHKDLGIDSDTAKNFRWARTWMGSRSSPYTAVRYFYIAEEFVRGNRLDNKNALRWAYVKLNLPGDKSFDPTKPRVQKWDEVDEEIAGDVITFVDDGRISASRLERAWNIQHQVCSRLQYKGIQAALRKVYPPTQSPGPWAGSIFSTTDNTIIKTVSIDKWNKAKKIVDALWSKLDQPDWLKQPLEYKELEVVRGFLGHISMTFEIMTPYLKGFHLTLASHLNKRDKEGWKYTDRSWKIYLDHKVGEGSLSHEEASKMFVGNPYTNVSPKTILPVKQLKDDLYAIREFLSDEQPPRMQERSTRVRIVRYGFGDASGSGFGSTIQTKEGLSYRIGIWGSDDDNESSNFKELENVVSTIEAEASSGNLDSSVLFFFTDNSTVEAALYKGNSTSKKLYHLVVRFRKLQFKHGTHIIVSHVAGKRMIEQGTDGVSRGNLHEGVGTGMEMLSFIPMHLNACDRHQPIKEWMKAWMGQEIEFLDPTGWFTRGHDHDGGSYDRRGFWTTNLKHGTFVWAPPPGAAEVAIEEMRKALIKRQTSTHIFVCPRLLTTEWMKQLHKTADIILSIPAGCDPDAWPLSMHEPLTIGFVFPLLHCKPWQRKSTPQMFYMERELSKLFKGKGVVTRDFLREFFTKQKKLSDMSELLVRRVLYLTK